MHNDCVCVFLECHHIVKFTNWLTHNHFHTAVQQHILQAAGSYSLHHFFRIYSECLKKDRFNFLWLHFSLILLDVSTLTLKRIMLMFIPQGVITVKSVTCSVGALSCGRSSHARNHLMRLVVQHFVSCGLSTEVSQVFFFFSFFYSLKTQHWVKWLYKSRKYWKYLLCFLVLCFVFFSYRKLGYKHKALFQYMQLALLWCFVNKTMWFTLQLLIW